jgi:adenosylmethionine-8-amino-7-oxononanoate aminotransferase
VLPRYLDRAYPSVESATGVWLLLPGGRRLLDACSGGAMTTCLGHGNEAAIDAAARQGAELSYTYMHHFSNEPQERLAAELIATAAPAMDRIRFVTGGSEANETALRLIRSYHVENGEPDRWRIISPAQAYHGSLIGTLALSGRPSLQESWTPYLSSHLHLPPSTPSTDPTGAEALAELDRVLAEASPGTIAAYVCEPVSAAALPGYSPPAEFWRGLAERAAEHGFLVCCDEIVTGMGRTGTWLASDQLPIEPDVVTLGKGLGAGYAPLAAVLCTRRVYDAIDAGSGDFDHGHTWDGAPLPCAVGGAVLRELVERGLVDRVHDRGPALLDQLAAAVAELPLVREVRGRGFLLGLELVDPRDGESPLPAALDVERRVTAAALAEDLLLAATSTAVDGFVGDQVLLAPAFVSSDDELALMVERTAAALASAQDEIAAALEAAA